MQEQAERDAQAVRAARAPVAGSLADLEDFDYGKNPSIKDPNVAVAAPQSARQFFEGLQRSPAPVEAPVAVAPVAAPVEQSSAATNASPAAAPAPVAAPVVSPKAAVQHSSGALREAPNSTPPTDRDDSGTRIEPTQGTAVPESHPVEAALAAQGVDPTVARMLADRARAQDELKGAQTKANRDAALVIGSNQGINLLLASSKMAPMDYSAEVAQANKPVADVLARQKAAGESMALSENEQKFGAAADAANPGSQANKEFRDFVKTEMKINLPPNATMDRFKPLAEMYQKEREGREKSAAELQKEEFLRKSVESEGAKNRATQREIAQLAHGPGSREIGEDTTRALANIKSGRAELEDLDTSVGGKGALSSLWAALPATENNVWQAQRDQLVESTANALAGGKKAGQILVKKVDQSFPKIGDTQDVKDQKKANLLRMFGTNYNTLLEGLQATGRNVSGLERLPEGSARPTAPAAGVVERGGKRYQKINGQWHEL